MVVPVGTVVYDVDTEETLGDLTRTAQRMLVAKGGHGGLGNQHFKSSTNRTPRQATPGYHGEKRELRLELKLIADVGLLGLPNAGKSTLISVGFGGAAEDRRLSVHDAAPEPGRGLRRRAPELRDGRHPRPDRRRGGRCRARHPVPEAPAAHAAAAAPDRHRAARSGRRPGRGCALDRGRTQEVQPGTGRARALAGAQQARPAAADAEAEKRCKEIVRRLRWKGPVYRISGATQQGTKELCQAIMQRLEVLAPVPAPAEAEAEAATRVDRAASRLTERCISHKKAGSRPAFSLDRQDRTARRFFFG